MTVLLPAPTAPGTCLRGLPPVRSVFQPIIDLFDGATVGYESLVRGVQGAPLATPADLFGWAGAEGRVADLDWACRIAALRGALDGGLQPGTGLFVNVEPIAFAASVPDEFAGLAARADAAGLRVVVEVTERSLGRDPAGLLRFADAVRSRGWALAIDDVGADVGSLALMPFLAPDVVKLDLRLIQDRTTVEVARIVSAVNAQAARTGALVLAEGIETEQHEELALSMGAHLGQGWRYGRPEPLSPSPARRLRALPVVPKPRDAAPADVPWDLVRHDAAVRRARKPLLAAMSRHLEHQARGGDGSSVVLGTFQRDRYFTASTAARYSDIASSVFVVAALGEGMDTEPAPGVRGVDLAAGDPLVDEWTVAVVSPHFAGALIAHDCGDGGPEAERRFDYVVTYDRDTVLRAAASLLRRLPLAGGAGA